MSWEYRTERAPESILDERLRKLNRDGWEVVSVTYTKHQLLNSTETVFMIVSRRENIQL